MAISIPKYELPIPIETMDRNVRFVYLFGGIDNLFRAIKEDYKDGKKEVYSKIETVWNDKNDQLKDEISMSDYNVTCR